MFSNSKIKNKIIVFTFLFLIFCLAFFVRTYFPYKIVFSDGIIKYNDDAVYHMRFLENMLLGGHFPSFFYFDPFTNFPHGTYSSPAPLYDFILAVFIWLVSFGKPTIEIVKKIAPFYPAFLGSLIPIVIYFLAKALWNNPKISLTSAFFIAISPIIIFKSLLAANDHHVAEVLLSSLALMFLFYALKSPKKWLFVFLCAFSMGLYLLTWAGAILFFFIIFVFLAIYYLIEFLSKRPCNWILVVGAIIFLIPFLMITPFLGHPSLNSGTYNINHLLCFGLGLLGFFVLWLFSFIIQKKSFDRWQIVLFLVGFSLIFLLFLQIIFPYIFTKFIILLSGVNNNGLAFVNFKSFIEEMKPMKFGGAIDYFSSLFFFYLLGFFIVIYNFYKEKNPKNLLLIIWTTVTLLITGIFPFFGQNRYMIYLAVNIAIFAGFVVVKGFAFGFEALHISSRLEKVNFPFKNYFLVGSIMILSSLVFFIVYPFPFNAGLPWPRSMPDLVAKATDMAKKPFALDTDWYAIFKWLREKTPDPGLNYYALYNEPGIDKKTGNVNDYSYPVNSYGVLANPDVGHAIVYYAHRFAVANPFQQGIGRKINGKITELGEGVFFLETDEKKAISYLDQLKVKYVVTDSKFASLDAGYFDIMVKWVQGNLDGYLNTPKNSPNKYDNSMIARLHFLDGSKTVIKKELDSNSVNLTMESLNYFRLLYESDTSVRIFPYKNIANEDVAKEIKAEKIFEYVKGAKIKGMATPFQEVVISAKIVTNQGRKFIYENSISAKEDGSFEFVLPYSTGKQEQSDVSASEYELKIGNWIRKIKVSEDDVLQGKIIQI